MGRSLVICARCNYTGYGRHVTEIIRALDKLGIRVKLIDPPKGGRPFDTSDLPVDSNVILHVRMPQTTRIVDGMLSVNCTTFEATRIPECWVKPSLSHDLIVLPTDSAKQAWMESGCPEDRLRLCSLGVDSGQFHPAVEPLDLGNHRGRRVLEYATRFLNVSAFISAPRKNILGMLRVWIKATNANDDAILILKLRGYRHQWWWPDKFTRALNAMEREIGKTRKRAAPVFFYTQTLSNARMPGLYAAATHYWSMSHGEGWDLPMMEAGAMGLHLIAPKHTAYTAYLDESVAQMIPSRRVPADFNGVNRLKRLFEGSDWWQPDEEIAADLIRQAIRTPNNGSPRARERITSNFTWEQSAARLVEILEELHEGRGKKF
jgi:glycosyltransferase involved in cell wall biosynthesis